MSVHRNLQVPISMVDDERNNAPSSYYITFFRKKQRADFQQNKLIV